MSDGPAKPEDYPGKNYMVWCDICKRTHEDPTQYAGLTAAIISLTHALLRKPPEDGR